MSVLLVGADRDLGAAVIARLIAAGDEVRAVENDPDLAARWRAMGAHVARGGPDPDLVERAGQNCRTIVLFAFGMTEGAIDDVLDGAADASIERALVCSPGLDPGVLAALERFGGQYVAMALGPAGRVFGRRRAVEASEVARAVDAADDLGGEVRLELDLTEPAAWTALGLTPP